MNTHSYYDLIKSTVGVEKVKPVFPAPENGLILYEKFKNGDCFRIKWRKKGKAGYGGGDSEVEEIIKISRPLFDSL